MIIIVINKVQFIQSNVYFPVQSSPLGSLHIYFSSAATAQNGHGNPLSELHLFPLNVVQVLDIAKNHLRPNLIADVVLV